MRHRNSDQETNEECFHGRPIGLRNHVARRRRPFADPNVVDFQAASFLLLLHRQKGQKDCVSTSRKDDFLLQKEIPEDAHVQGEKTEQDILGSRQLIEERFDLHEAVVGLRAKLGIFPQFGRQRIAPIQHRANRRDHLGRPQRSKLRRESTHAVDL